MLSFLKGKKDKEKAGRKLSASSGQQPSNGKHGSSETTEEIDDHSHHELLEEDDDVIKPGTVLSLVSQFGTAPPKPTTAPPPVPSLPPPISLKQSATTLKSPNAPLAIPKQTSKLKSILRGDPSVMSAYEQQPKITVTVTKPAALRSPANNTSLLQVAPQVVTNGGVNGALSPSLAIPSAPAYMILPPLPVRASAIRRLPRGDFGIILRQAATLTVDESSQRLLVRGVVFAEPNVVSQNQPLTLLPGDELLEVGETSVSGCSRDDIVNLFRRASDTVVLRFQQAGEFREISLNFFSDNIPSSDNNGRIRRGRGSALRRADPVLKVRRFSSNSTMGSDGTDDRTKVWLNHERGFCMARQVANESDDYVTVEVDGTQLGVRQANLFPRNPLAQNFVADLSRLSYLNEPAILNTLIQRFANGLCHTVVGTSSYLVSLTPMRPMYCYSEKVFRMFNWTDCCDDLPHPFSLAANVLANMQRSRQDQTVVFLGLGGSGKSSMLRHVASALLDPRVSSSPCAITPSRLNAALTILDAFGSCLIGNNAASSRYTLLSSINYDQQGRPLGVVLAPNFLDRYRVAYRGDSQRQASSPTGSSDSYSNFSIFYYLLAGISAEERAELMLDMHQHSGAQNVLVEMNFPNAQMQKANADKWVTLTNCMDELNISGDERRGVWRTIAAIIHLGFAGFVHTPTGNGQFYRMDSAQRAADLLGVKVEDLTAAVFAASKTGTGQSAPGSRNSTLTLSATTNTSQAAFRAFVSGLYAHLFAAITALINRRLTTHSNRAMYTVHLLDTPGLQRVGDLNGASFMDFCYNYVTERLLGLYVSSAFTSPLDAFVQEDVDSGLELNLEVPLDANRTLLDTFDGRDQSSLFWLLDQEILSPTGSDDGFLNRLFTAAHDRFRSSTASIHQDGFQLLHAFGQFPIIYRIAGWMAAMTEHHAFYTSADLLRSSISPSVGAVFSAILDLPAGSSILRPPSIRRSPCLAMKCQVDQFLEPLRRTRHHFSLSVLTSSGKSTISPPNPHPANNTDSPESPQQQVDVAVDFIRAQFRAFLIEELVKLQKYGCTESFRYTDFVRSFRLQLPTTTPLETDDPRLATTLILQSATIEQRSFRFGKNRIFLCREALQELESLREERLGEVVIKLQALCRSHLARKRCERLRVQHAAVRCIQKNVAKWAQFREWPWWRLYVRIKPLINVHKTEEELRSRQEEAMGFRQKFERSENEKADLMQTNAKLEFKIKQLESALAEQTAAQQQASDMLETETFEKQKLLTEFSDMKKRFVKHTGSPAAALMASSVVLPPPPSPLASVSAVLDTRLAVERDELIRQLEERAETHKCKSLKLGAELQDVRYELEQTRTALADAERRLGRSDTDISVSAEEARRERVKCQHLQQECDTLKLERGRMENEIIDLSEAKNGLEERVSSLQAQISALTATALPESLELASLRRKVDELNLKCKDQEEELDEQAGDIQMLQAAKLNLQMQFAQTSQSLQKVQEEKDNEIQDIRAALLRRARAAEQQLEEEQVERQRLARDKRTLEAQLHQLQSEQAENEERRVLATERRLRSKLAATRALLQASQLTISRLKASGEKNTNGDIRALEERAEDAEQKAARLAKAKQRLESDLAAMNEEMARLQVVRTELEKRCAALVKEKGDLEDQIGEHDDDLTEANDKLRAAVAERSVDKVTVDAQAQEIIKLEERLQASEERCSALETRLELFQAKMIDKQEFIKLEMQTRTLEGYLQLERAERARLENALERAKQKAETSGEAVVTFEELLRNERQRSSRLEKDLNAVTEEAQDNARRLTDVETKLNTLTTEACQLQKLFEDREEQLHLAYQNISTMQKVLEEKASSSADEDEDDEDDDEEFGDVMFEGMSQNSEVVAEIAPSEDADLSSQQPKEEEDHNGIIDHDDNAPVNGHTSASNDSYSSDSIVNGNHTEEGHMANGGPQALLA